MGNSPPGELSRYGHSDLVCFESLISTELPSCETNQVKNLLEIYGNVREINLHVYMYVVTKEWPEHLEIIMFFFFFFFFIAYDSKHVLEVLKL